MTKEVDFAVEQFNQGYACSQSVLAAFAEQLGLPLDVAHRIALPFGGGMGRYGQTCGAVTGALMVFGLQSTGEPDAKDEVYRQVQAFMTQFNELYGSVTCPGLLGYHIGDPDQRQQANAAGLFATQCPLYVAGAVELVQALLAQSETA